MGSRKLIGGTRSANLYKRSGLYTADEIYSNKIENKDIIRDSGKLRNYDIYPETTGTVDPYLNHVVMHLPGASYSSHMAKDHSGNAWDEYYYTTSANSTSSRQEMAYVETGPRELFSTFFFDQHYTVTNAAALQFGTSNFTIEFWIKVGRIYSAGDSYIMGKGGNAARTAGTGWVIYFTNAQKIGFYDAVGNTSTQSATSLALDTWIHVAIVRTGTAANQTMIFINGALDVNGTSAGNFTETNNLIIGKDRAASGTTHFNGYLFDIRIKTSAEYTTSFTAPTAPLNMTGAVFSLSGVNQPWHPIYPALQPEGLTVTCSGNWMRRVEDHPFLVNYPKPTGSGYSSAKLYDRGWQIADFRNPSQNLHLGTGAFTIECWLYFTPGADGGTVGICGKGTGNDATAGATGWNFTINNSNFPSWANGANAVVSGTVALSTNAWNHVAAVREGTGSNQFKMYVNGLLSYTGTLDTNYTDTTNPFVLCGSRNYQHNLRGCRISCFKVSTIARYTAEFAINRDTFFDTVAAAGDVKLYTLDAKNQVPKPPKAQWINDGYENIPIIAKTYGSVRMGGKARMSSGGYSIQNTDGSANTTLFSSTSNSSFTFNADNFSIEFWYCNQFEWERLSDATPRIFFDNRDSYNGTGIALEYEFRSLRILSAGRVILSDPTAYFAQRAWVHVCVQRTSSNLAIYINGKKTAETYYPNSFSNSTGKMYWMNGAYGVRNDRRTYGYFSDIRICKPVAAYSSGNTNPEYINVPTEPLTATANTVFLTANGPTIKDYSASQNPVWAGNRLDANYTSSWDNWITPFSPYRMPYTELGSSDHWDSSNCGARAVVDTDNSNWQQHENFWPMRMVRPWTIEYWFYHFQSNPSSITTHTHYYTSATNNGDGWQFIVNYAGNANSYNDITMIWRLGRLAANANEWINTSGGNGNINPHSWNHVAVVFDPSKATNVRLAMFVNGKRVATRSPFTQSYGSAYYDRLQWGGVHGASDLRISDVARYDNNEATYTVPAAPWTRDANTAVLLRQELPFKNLPGKASHLYDGLVVPSYQYTKWGSGSINFANLDASLASYDRIYLQHMGVWADRMWDVRYGDFTVEGWANWSDVPSGGLAYPANLACLYHYQDFIWVGINSSGTWQLLVRSGTTTSQTGITIVAKSVALASANSWNHWALVRQAGDFYLYIDGVLSMMVHGGNHGTYTSNGPTVNRHNDLNTVNNSRVGQNNSGTIGEAWCGHLEDFRLTALARYHTSWVNDIETMCHIGTSIPAMPTEAFPKR